MMGVRSRMAVIATTFVAFTFAAPEAGADQEPLITEAIVNAPVGEVWRLFTTREGMESWMVAHGEIDLRIGGYLRSHYDPKGALGDPQTIVNQVLSFEPERMLSIQVHQPPADFPWPEAVRETWTVIYFQPLEPGMTNVRVVGLGFGDDADSRQLKEHFRKGNAWTLEKLQKKFWPTCASCEKK